MASLSNMPKSKLCTACQNLDIRRLVLAAEKRTQHKPSGGEEATNFVDLTMLELGSDDAYQHQPSLLSLRTAAKSCHLCAEIWRILENSTGVYNSSLDDSTLATGVAGTPLYMTVMRAYGDDAHFPRIMVFQRHDESRRTVFIASLIIYADRESVPQGTRDLLPWAISPFSGSDEALRLAKELLVDCYTNHKRCRQLAKHPGPPSRLIDVSSHPRLVDARGSEEYIALSYSRGGEGRTTMLDRTTEAQFRESLPDSALPATMSDAITVTRHLGLKYIWIDALCIQQDDEEDLLVEVAKMRHIYRGAILTLIGSSAAKASDRMFAHRNDQYVKIPWSVDETNVHNMFLCAEHEEEKGEWEWSKAPVNSRGWCFQEAILARRCLWIGKQAMLFECAERQIDELGRIRRSTEVFRSKRVVHDLSKQENWWLKSALFRACGIPPIIYVPIVHTHWSRFWNSKDVRHLFRVANWHKMYVASSIRSSVNWRMRRWTIYDYWYQIVSHCSERKLSWSTDLFPALSGLAEAFSRATGEQYAAGMWKGDLLRSLTWRNFSNDYDGVHRKAYISQVVRERRSLGYVAPSWSWASCAIRWPVWRPRYKWMQSERQPIWRTQHEWQQLEQAFILDVWTKPKDDAYPFGQLQDAELTLRAPSVRVTDPRLPPGFFCGNPKLLDWLYSFCREDSDRAWNSPGEEFHFKHEDHPGQDFAVLRIGMFRYVGSGSFVFETDDRLVELWLVETCGPPSHHGSVPRRPSASHRYWRRVAGFSCAWTGDYLAWLSDHLEEATPTSEIANMNWQTEIFHVV